MSAENSRRLIRWGLAAWGLFQPISVAGANMATAVVLAGVLGHWYASRSLPSLRSPLGRPLLAYVAAALACSALALDPADSFRHINNEVHKAGLFFVFLAAFSIEDSPAPLFWWAAGSMAAAAVGILQVLGWHAFGPFDPNAGPYYKWCEAPHLFQFVWLSSRAHGTVNAVTYGEIMGLALVGGACFAAARRREGLPVGGKAAGFCALAAAAWVLSGTRGAWLGAALSLGLVVLLLAPRRALWALGGAAAAGALLFFAAGRLRSGGALDSISFTCRYDLWSVALQMFRDHPLFGVGLHNYGSSFARYHYLPFAGFPSWGDAHNLYLDQLAERGAVGLAALLYLFGAMLRQAWLRWRASGSFLSLWCFSWLAGFLFMNLTESAFQVAMVWMPTLALCAWMEKGGERVSPAGLKV